jgi:hypothetical protein
MVGTNAIPGHSDPPALQATYGMCVAARGFPLPGADADHNAAPDGI